MKLVVSDVPTYPVYVNAKIPMICPAVQVSTVRYGTVRYLHRYGTSVIVFSWLS